MAGIPHRTHLFSAICVLALSLPSCSDRRPAAKTAPDAPKDFTHPDEITTGPDGIARRQESEAPYTGAAIIRDRDWNLRYFAYYQDGKLHGPEMKFWDNGRVRRNFDYQAGEKVRHREWFENGNPKIDATFASDLERRPHRTWFEDGSPRWSGHFVGELQWDGHIVDYAPGGKLMWDAIFDHGRYVSGVYPESEQENLIKAGMLKPEDAVYPRQKEDSAPSPAPGADQ